MMLTILRVALVVAVLVILVSSAVAVSVWVDITRELKELRKDLECMAGRRR